MRPSDITDGIGAPEVHHPRVHVIASMRPSDITDGIISNDLFMTQNVRELQ